MDCGLPLVDLRALWRCSGFSGERGLFCTGLDVVNLTFFTFDMDLECIRLTSLGQAVRPLLSV